MENHLLRGLILEHVIFEGYTQSDRFVTGLNTELYIIKKKLNKTQTLMTSANETTFVKNRAVCNHLTTS